jgi:hypothetical protein
MVVRKDDPRANPRQHAEIPSHQYPPEFLPFRARGHRSPLGHHEFDEILERVKAQHPHGALRQATGSPDQAQRGKRAQTLSYASCPFHQGRVLKLLALTLGSRPYSGSLSNLGPVAMPDDFAHRISHFDFLPSRDRATGANVGVISWKDELSITVGSSWWNATSKGVFPDHR